MNKIYDCFSFFNEFEILELRLMELYDYVDYFVICESNKTHSGKNKPYYYEENKNKFEIFKNKIIHLKINNNNNNNNNCFKNPCNSWDLENYQRNYLINGLYDCTQDDIIILSDVDEIPNTKCISEYKENKIMKPVSLRQKIYYYYINYILTKSSDFFWSGTQIFRYSNLKNINLQKIRDVRTFLPHLNEGGWHFSYLGGIDRIMYKIDSFAHVEFNTKELNNKENLLKNLNELKIYYSNTNIDNDIVIKKIEINDSYPKSIHKIIEKYPYLLKK